MASTVSLWIRWRRQSRTELARRRFTPALLASAPRADRFDQPLQRLQGVASAIGLHRKMLRKPRGILHAIIFVSFFVLFTATIEAFGSRLFPGFSLAPIGGETWIAGSPGHVCRADARRRRAGALPALSSRSRLASWDRAAGDGRAIIYVLIVLIVASLLLEAAARIQAAPTAPGARWPRFWPAVLGRLGVPARAAEAVFSWSSRRRHPEAFLVYIPGSKHRHMVMPAASIS